MASYGEKLARVCWEVQERTCKRCLTMFWMESTILGDWCTHHCKQRQTLLTCLRRQESGCNYWFWHSPQSVKEEMWKSWCSTMTEAVFNKEKAIGVISGTKDCKGKIWFYLTLAYNLQDQTDYGDMVSPQLLSYCLLFNLILFIVFSWTFCRVCLRESTLFMKKITIKPSNNKIYFRARKNTRTS